MIGAIVGDIAASVYERRKYAGGDWNAELFPKGSRFTDDTVLTVACFDAMTDIGRGEKPEKAFLNRFQEYAKLYPNAGYGRQFREWIGNPLPYGSFGNGAAMRVSPIGWLCDDAPAVLKLAAASAMVSHDHSEGIKAAQAAALAVFLARNGAGKEEIRKVIAELTGYNLDRKLVDIRPTYRWSSHSQTSVPEAIICFLDSVDFEGAVRGAIWLGGDADTQAAIAGSIAEAFYGGVPAWMLEKARGLLDRRLDGKAGEWLDGKPYERLGESGEDLIISGCVFIESSPACPEQYDVFKGGHYLGYVRLRGGRLTARLMPGGELIYSHTFPNPLKGGFTDDQERDTHLKKIALAFAEAHDQ